MTTTVPACTVRCLSSLGEAELLRPQLEVLQLRAGCPVTARWSWQSTWLATWPWDRLLLVVVERGPDLVAAAPLAARRHGRTWRVVPVGDGPSDRVQLACVGAPDELARGVADALDGLGRRWTLQARHLDPADPVLAALLRTLAHAGTSPGDLSPTTIFTGDRDVRGYVSRNAHQQVRRMRNRIAREGHVLELRTVRDAEEVRQLLPEMMRVHRARDLQLGRDSDVDHASRGPFLRALLQRLAGEGAVELTVVRLDGQLAAYVLCFVDDRARRMWNCRFDPGWERYAPGRLALHAALETALADPACGELDWMRGTEEYKAQLSNGSWRAVDLHACSRAPAWAARRSLLTSVAAARRLRDRSPFVARLGERLRPWTDRRA